MYQAQRREPTMDMRRRGRRHAGITLLACTATVLAAGVAACSSGNSSSGSSSASATQTIVFAESGLGAEGEETQKQINAFEAANPTIKVSIQVLSPDSTTYLSQLEH